MERGYNIDHRQSSLPNSFEFSFSRTIRDKQRSKFRRKLYRFTISRKKKKKNKTESAPSPIFSKTLFFRLCIFCRLFAPWNTHPFYTVLVHVWYSRVHPFFVINQGEQAVCGTVCVPRVRVARVTLKCVRSGRCTRRNIARNLVDLRAAGKREDARVKATR